MPEAPAEADTASSTDCECEIWDDTTAIDLAPVPFTPGTDSFAFCLLDAALFSAASRLGTSFLAP